LNYIGSRKKMNVDGPLLCFYQKGKAWLQ